MKFIFVFYCLLTFTLCIRVPSLEQLTRLELINYYCNNSGINSEIIKQLDHILIEPKHKLIYCYVPKVACTNWKRILYVLAGKTNQTNLSDIPANLVHETGTLSKLNQLKLDEIFNIINNNAENGYTKLIVVRHPFERLLSAYRNKLEGSLPSAKYFQARIGRYIIKKYRSNPSNTSIETGSDVTFREFVQYLVTDNQSKIEMINEHWRPINQICHPCIIDYSYVIKYEYLIEEAEILLDLINAKNIEFPMTKVSKTNERLQKYFQQLSIEEIKQLYEFYKLDFVMFGYDLENILGYDIG